MLANSSVLPNLTSMFQSHRLLASSESKPRPSRKSPSRMAATAPHHLLPPITIEDQSSRAPHVGPGIASSEFRDRTERRVAPSSQSCSPADRLFSEMTGRSRSAGQHVRSFLMPIFDPGESSPSSYVHFNQFDPPLDRDSSLGSQGSNNTELPGPAHLLNNTQMPQRVDSFPISSPYVLPGYD